METALKSNYSNPDAENLLYDLEEKGLRIVARSGQLVVKPKKAIPADDEELQEERIITKKMIIKMSKLNLSINPP